MPASWPIWRELTSISRKLVKTAKCQPNMSKRPVIVPIIQNGVQKSPLDFLGFLFSVAFSHKELMVPFERTLALYCQNDEVSPVCTRVFWDAKGSPIPPDVTAASCSW